MRRQRTHAPLWLGADCRAELFAHLRSCELATLGAASKAYFNMTGAELHARMLARLREVKVGAGAELSEEDGVFTWKPASGRYNIAFTGLRTEMSEFEVYARKDSVAVGFGIRAVISTELRQANRDVLRRAEETTKFNMGPRKVRTEMTGLCNLFPDLRLEDGEHLAIIPPPRHRGGQLYYLSSKTVDLRDPATGTTTPFKYVTDAIVKCQHHIDTLELDSAFGPVVLKVNFFDMMGKNTLVHILHKLTGIRYPSSGPQDDHQFVDGVLAVHQNVNVLGVRVTPRARARWFVPVGNASM